MLCMLAVIFITFHFTGTVWTIDEESIAIEKIASAETDFPQSVLLDIEEILQMPELPTGCESVALTMALCSLGYEMEKTTIADHYLEYNSENFAAGYMGDPYSDNGAGVLPPGLVETANKFLKEQKDQRMAYDISDIEFDGLFKYLAAGHPVLIWITMYYEQPVFLDNYSEYNGKEYQWYSNEHCVLLGGYDLQQGNVTVFDPLEGKLDVEIPTVEGLYNATGKNAMTIY